MDAAGPTFSRRARSRTAATWGCALGTVLVVAGCSVSVNPGTHRGATPAQPTPAAVLVALDPVLTLPDAASAPPFPETMDPVITAPSPGAMLTVTDIRVAHHEGFDRVVYEMAGSGLPGWTVAYVPQAVQDGSGMVIDVEGPATLGVSIYGSGYPSDTGATPFSHPTPVRGDGTAVVTEVQGWSAFEGTTGSFIGLADLGHDFRVFLLDNPVRVVVDVAETR